MISHNYTTSTVLSYSQCCPVLVLTYHAWPNKLVHICISLPSVLSFSSSDIASTVVLSILTAVIETFSGLVHNRVRLYLYVVPFLIKPEPSDGESVTQGILKSSRPRKTEAILFFQNYEDKKKKMNKNWSQSKSGNRILSGRQNEWIIFASCGNYHWGWKKLFSILRLSRFWYQFKNV